jgi:hypothetical protein
VWLVMGYSGEHGWTDVRSNPVIMKSQETSTYLSLLFALYSDVASVYPAQHSVEIQRDFLTISRRTSLEGMSFLTKTLPSLAKAIDFSLAHGSPLRVVAFAKRRQSELPRFLGWLIGEIFDDTGSERLDASPIALKHLRDILYLFYKLEIPCSDAVNDQTIANFVITDREVLSQWTCTTTDGAALRRAASAISRVLANADPRAITPGHGPGAVSGGQTPVEKPIFRQFNRELDNYYSFTEYFYLSANHLVDRLTPEGLPLSEGTKTAKVVLVPKDSRGPRIISMESTETQWIQQGQMSLLYTTVERHPLTRGHVNFRDQGVNRDLALKASVTQEWVTIDMKEASDRVSQQHVACLFPLNWVEALFASRSTETRLPDGQVLSLNKFAPMGSATCFPVEALVFWALAIGVLTETYPMREAIRMVYVYGDDIIIPKKDYLRIISLYERVGLKTNPHKCCVGPHFRESCGMDAYKGICVTPLRLKKPWNRHLAVSSLVSFVSFANIAQEQGYEQLGFEVARLVNSRSLLRVSKWKLALPRIPYINHSEYMRGACLFMLPHGSRLPRDLTPYSPQIRKNREEQRMQVKTWAAVGEDVRRPEDNYEYLLDSLVKLERRPDTPIPSRLRRIGLLKAHAYLLREELEPAVASDRKPDYYPLRSRVTPKLRWISYFK